jgi:hypothetical protein
MAVKRKRKMTEEQREAAAERLAKARAARAANATPEYKNIHEKVLKRADDHPLSLPSIRAVIKHNRDKITAEKQNLRIGDKHAIARIASMEGYIRNLNGYLQHGDYTDMFYGSDQQYRTQSICHAPSYNEHGEINRIVNVWYQDLGMVWTQEMDTEWRRTRGY